MKGRLLLLLLLATLLGTAGYLLSHNPRAWPTFNRRMVTESLAGPPSTPATPNPVAVPAVASETPLAAAETNAAFPSTNGTAAAALPPELTPLAALEQTRIALHLYASMLGENPVGLNFEITRALNGHNPKHVNFIRAEAGMRLNAQGELVDLWGTPYFFHQLSGTQMEIRSAGPDRILWTADDLVAR